MIEIDRQIHLLAERRAQLWREGDPRNEVRRVSELLQEAYAARRRALATSQHGNPAEIIRRARIESELERLMSEA